MNFNLISDSLVVQKKSKFIGMLFKIDSKEDVASIISYVKDENKGYRHIPYAYKVNNTGGKSKFTWTRGSARTNILACANIHCSNIDDMLNDMANMSASFASNETVAKTISLIGTRTTASDTAVQALQSKGYTVSITPA